MSKQLTSWCVGRFAQFPRVMLTYAFQGGDQADFEINKTWVHLRLDLHVHSPWAKGEQSLKSPQAQLRYAWVTVMEAAQLLVAHRSCFCCCCFGLEYVCWKYPWTVYCLASASFLLWNILARVAQLLVGREQSFLISWGGVPWWPFYFFFLSTQYSHISHLML